MNRKTARISVTLFALICTAMLVAINTITKGNFITAPAISLFIYMPLMLVQAFLLVQVWIIEKIATRALKWSFWSSLLITLTFIYFFYNFLAKTT